MESIVTGYDLIEEYAPGSSFFFASPRHTLLATGTAVRLPARDADLPAYTAGLLDALRGDGAPPLAVGAVPFADPAGAHLVVPAAAHWAEPLSATRPARGGAALAYAGQRPDHGGYELRPVPEPGEYVRGVEQALGRMAAGELDKVVLARTLHLRTAQRIDMRTVLRNLATRDPRGYTFAADLPHGRTLVGASPELLVSRHGRRVVAHPLAGSAARSADPVQDARRAATLRSSEKDRHEHAFVVDAIAAALAPYCKNLDVPVRPSVVPTATMWHLASRITGELADEAVSALELAGALHPTPAICGTPVGPARDAIAELEPVPRGFYTGMVGWVDAEGDGEWVVTIRCGEADERSLRLYAGAGIVSGSTPADELAETSAKFATLLEAMGMSETETV
jgi:isochorismate synthase